MKYLRVRKIFYLPVITFFMVAYIIAGLSDSVEVHHVYKVFPAFIVYTDHLYNGNAGEAKGLLVFIKPEFRECNETREHELMHVKQSYRYLFQNWWLLLISDDMLMKMETEAYALHISDKDNIPMWATMIKEEYDLHHSQEQIEKQLLLYWTEQRS